MTPEQILDIKMQPNDADADTIRAYLGQLLITLWDKEEMFSGKRPFGNSGWKYDLYNALVLARAVEGTVIEEDGYQEVDCSDTEAADRLIGAAIQHLVQVPRQAS